MSQQIILQIWQSLASLHSIPPESPVRLGHTLVQGQHLGRHHAYGQGLRVEPFSVWHHPERLLLRLHADSDSGWLRHSSARGPTSAASWRVSLEPGHGRSAAAGRHPPRCACLKDAQPGIASPVQIVLDMPGVPALQLILMLRPAGTGGLTLMPLSASWAAARQVQAQPNHVTQRPRPHWTRKSWKSGCGECSMCMPHRAMPMI